MAKLYFHYAAMNAGKSTTLLQASFNYRERGMETMVFTAGIDDRVAKGIIASRIGLQSEANIFGDGIDIFAAVRARAENGRLACVFVDEAQFLSRAQVFQLAQVVDELGLPVLCYGLRTDFRGELFEGSQWLLALADEIHELKTICACGAKATMTLRIDPEGRAVREGASVEIGGNDRYVPLCRRHFLERFRGG
jgi:thymidine kinase